MSALPNTALKIFSNGSELASHIPTTIFRVLCKFLNLQIRSFKLGLEDCERKKITHTMSNKQPCKKDGKTLENCNGVVVFVCEEGTADKTARGGKESLSV